MPSGRCKGINVKWLTDDFGLPELKNHLEKLAILMDASSNQKKFEQLLDRSLPKFGDTIGMALDDLNGKT